MAQPSTADSPPVQAAELPRFRPVEPGQAVATFEVKPGFHLELVAAEPQVVSPIALSFDEDGRMFVLEMIDYSERRDEHLGRVRCLVDTQGNGRFDQSTVYADGLPWPTALTCWRGGVFVGATPDVFYFRDSQRNGVADFKQYVFTGFGLDYAPYQPDRLNVQALFNGFTWGLDNRIHGATSFNGGKVTSLNNPQAPPLNLRGRDFSFEPEALALEAESGGGQYGLSFDDTGRKFVCSNADHLQLIMYEARYAARNRFFSLPNPNQNVAVDGPAAELYRLSREEPWRVLRTRWRVAGLVKGPVEGGGRASGYFTAASGITVYRGNAWPSNYLGDVFVADCANNLVHHKRLHPDGVSVRAERPADELKTEFLRSRDSWSRPVQLANAPDGTLYVIDMYREIIEHPWSLPKTIKQLVDLNSGSDRGRIYRIVPDGFQQPKPPRLREASTSELVATLAHPNGWHRDTAARLLYERQDPAAVPLLEAMLRQSPSVQGRLHALYSLAGLHRLTEQSLLAAMADSGGVVRRHTVRLSEPSLLGPQPNQAIRQRLSVLAHDADPLVRYQLAFTLGWLPASEKVPLLFEILRRDHEDPWVRVAVLTSLDTGAGETFARVAQDSDLRSSDGGRSFLRQLITVIAAQRQPPDLQVALTFLGNLSPRAEAVPLANALLEGLRRIGQNPGASVREALAPLFDYASAVAGNPGAREAERLATVRLLGAAPFAVAGPVLLAALDANKAPALQVAAIAALGEGNAPAVADELLSRWPQFTPRLREEGLAVLLKRAESTLALLRAVQKGEVQRIEISAARRESLRRHSDPNVRQLATVVFGASAAGQRQAVVDRYQPALQLSGDPASGQRTFLARCSSCHRLAGQGHQVGPDLATVRTAGKEKILVSILDPNREVAPNYLSYTLETKDGDSLVGIIANESANSVTLRRPYGEDTIALRDNLRRIESQGLSLMPEELEAGLTPQDLADLMEFILRADDPH